MPFEARKFMFTVSLCAMLAVNPVLATAATTVEDETTTVPSSPELNDGKLHLASVDFVKRSMASVDPQDRVSVYQGLKNQNRAMVTDKDGTVYPGYVTTDMIADGAVTAEKIYAANTGVLVSSGTGGGVAWSAVMPDMIDLGYHAGLSGVMVTDGYSGAWGYVTRGMIGYDAVTTDNIYDGAVTMQKIADHAVSTDKIFATAAGVLRASGSGDAYWGMVPADMMTGSSGDTGKVLMLDESGRGAWSMVTADMITGYSGDNRKVLMLNKSGQAYWGIPEGGGYDGGMVTADMITGTSYDYNKILMLNESGRAGWSSEITADMIAGGYDVGQVLMTDSSGNAYWGKPSGGGYDGGMVTADMISGYITTGVLLTNASGGVSWGEITSDFIAGGYTGQVLMTDSYGKAYWGTLVGGGDLQSGPTGSVLVTNASGIQWINGDSGQVLMTDGRKAYWGTPAGGGDLQSGTTGSVLVTNASGIQWINGTEGQVLMQGASGKVYWGTPAGGGYDGGTVTADMINPRGTTGVLWGTGATAEWRMVDSRMIAGGYAGQVLMTDSSGNAYWGTPSSGGYDGGMVTADMITGSTGNAGKVLMLNTSGYGAWGMVPADMITGSSVNAGKVLMLNTSGYGYWGTLVGGSDLQSGPTGSVLVTNASGVQWIYGTEGQVLMQGASGRVYWGTPAGGGYDGGMVPADMITGSSGDAGKVLMLDGSGHGYWGTPAGGGYDGGMVTADMITGTSYDYNKILMLNASGRAGWEKVTPDMISGYTTTGVLLTNARRGVSWGAITSDFIADGAIVSGLIADGAVTSRAIAYGAVTSAEIGSGAVTPGAIAAGAVTTDKVADGAITRDKTDGIVGTVPVGNASDPTSYATFWLEE